MMSDFLIAQIRTYVPMAVGAFLSWLTTLGFQLDTGIEAQLAVALTALFSGAYYWVARKIEQRFPRYGWLLGVAKQPDYKGGK
jgi:hypothetical protein